MSMCRTHARQIKQLKREPEKRPMWTPVPTKFIPNWHSYGHLHGIWFCSVVRIGRRRGSTRKCCKIATRLQLTCGNFKVTRTCCVPRPIPFLCFGPLQYALCQDAEQRAKQEIERKHEAPFGMSFGRASL